MKNRIQNIGLKKHSKKNERRCMEALRLANLIHPRSVLIDATVSADDTITFYAYSEDDPMLNAYGAALMEQENVLKSVVNSEAGTGIYRLVKGDEPAHVLAKLGETISFE